MIEVVPALLRGIQVLEVPCVRLIQTVDELFWLLQSAVADILFSSATTLVYIGGLLFFVAWLKKKRANQQTLNH